MPRLAAPAIASALSALALAGPPAQAQTSEAAQRGLDYARRVCAECHAVEIGVPTPPLADAPSFSDIAATPGMTSMALNVWLQTSHPTMPNLIVPQKAKEDLLAWFAVLREARKPAEADTRDIRLPGP